MADLPLQDSRPGNRRIREGMLTAIDVTGQRFERLIAACRDGSDDRGEVMFFCVCDCGGGRRVRSSMLRGGFTRSCGCWQPPRNYHRTHGHTANGTWSPEYHAWHHARQRCENPNDKDYGIYGGRGIKTCDRWRNRFANFLADMGPRPSPRHSLDRYPNNDGDYEPGNCLGRHRNSSERINGGRPERHDDLPAKNLFRRTPRIRRPRCAGLLPRSPLLQPPHHDQRRRWPDYVRLSDIESGSLCTACGERGAEVQPNFDQQRWEI